MSVHYLIFDLCNHLAIGNTDKYISYCTNANLPLKRHLSDSSIIYINFNKAFYITYSFSKHGDLFLPIFVYKNEGPYSMSKAKNFSCYQKVSSLCSNLLTILGYCYGGA